MSAAEIEFVRTLRRCLSNFLLVPIENGQASLFEPEAKQQVDLKFSGHEENIVLFTLDHSREKGEPDPVFPFFNSRIPGLCKRNDYILFVGRPDGVYCFLIELKSGSGSAAAQMRHGQIFCEYITQVLRLAEQSQITWDCVSVFGLRISGGVSSHRKAIRRRPTGLGPGPRPELQFSRDSSSTLVMADFKQSKLSISGLLAAATRFKRNSISFNYSSAAAT